jgi:hypothetical protein
VTEAHNQDVDALYWSDQKESMLHHSTTWMSSSRIRFVNCTQVSSAIRHINLRIQLDREVAGLTLVVPSLVPSARAKRSVSKEELFSH